MQTYVPIEVLNQVIDLYNESQRLVVELERHTSKMAKSLANLLDCPDVRLTMKYYALIDTHSLIDSTSKASSVVALIRRNRAAKTAVVDMLCLCDQQ